MLVVNKGFAPMNAPAAGGGFNWRQSVELWRGDSLIASAVGSDVTWKGDEQRAALPEEQAKVEALARPGDRLVVEGASFGNGGREWKREYIVASTMSARRATRPVNCWAVEDPLLSQQLLRPFRAKWLRIEREEKWASNRAALKAEAAARLLRRAA